MMRQRNFGSRWNVQTGDCEYLGIQRLIERENPDIELFLRYLALPLSKLSQTDETETIIPSFDIP